MYRIGIVSVVLLMYARAWLIYYPLFPMLYETHGNKEWVSELKSKSGDVPIIFENSYRRAPMYEFYSGIPAISLNNYMYRKNQYSIDGSEERVRGKKVLYVSRSGANAEISKILKIAIFMIWGLFRARLGRKIRVGFVLRTMF